MRLSKPPPSARFPPPRASCAKANPPSAPPSPIWRPTALTLFDRSARQPVLTAAGRKVLGHVQAILAASERLDALSIQLAGEVEPRLSMVFSDTYQPKHHDRLMQLFEQRYPEIELEWMIAEEGDVIDLLQSGRAHLGMVEVQKVIRRISPSPGCLSRPEWGCSSPISTRWPSRRANAGAAVQHPPADPEYLHRRRSGQTGWPGLVGTQLSAVAGDGGTGVRLGGAAALAGATIRPRQTHPAAAARLAKTDFGGCGLVQLTPPGPAGFWMLDRLLGDTQP